jgi:hypothetical protein
MIVIVYIPILSHTDFVGMCIICSHGKFHMPNYTVSLVITTKLKARCRFCMTAILCRTLHKDWNSTWYGDRLHDRGAKNQAAIPGRDKRFISSPKHPDWLWS